MADGVPRCLAVEGDTRRTDGHFVADPVLRAVDHAIAAALADNHADDFAVRAERFHGKGRGPIDDAVQAAAQTALDSLFVLVDDTDRLDHAFLVEQAALALMAQNVGDLAQVHGWEVHAAHIGHEAAHIGQTGHFNGVLSPV